MIGRQYLDILGEYWTLEDDSSGYLLRRISDLYVEVFETLDGFELVDGGSWGSM